jgi:hypothetical protein
LKALEVFEPGQEIFDELERRNLLIQLDGKVLSLIVPIDEVIGS